MVRLTGNTPCEEFGFTVDNVVTTAKALLPAQGP